MSECPKMVAEIVVAKITALMRNCLFAWRAVRLVCLIACLYQMLNTQQQYPQDGYCEKKAEGLYSG